MRLLTIESVLVATDLGDPSAAALRAAGLLAPLAGARLHLLHAADAPMPDGVARLREQLARTVPDAPEPESARVALGQPVAEILERAEQVAADVIVVGPHRRPPGDGADLGSTAARVVRTATCPCLVAATELRLPLRHVVVAIDPARDGGAPLAVALSWASALRPRGEDGRITVLHISASGGPDAAEAVRAAARIARDDAGGAAGVAIAELVAEGADPVREILARAADLSADLLVLGTRGAAAAHDDLGSVSAGVVRDAHCPVLLVPPAGR